MLYRTVRANKEHGDQLSRLDVDDVDFQMDARGWVVHHPHGRRNVGEKGGLSASRSDTRNGALKRVDLPSDFTLGDKRSGSVKMEGVVYQQLLLFESNEAEWVEPWAVHADGNPEDDEHVLLCPGPTQQALDTGAFDTVDADCEHIDEMQTDGTIAVLPVCRSARATKLVERVCLWRLCGLALKARSKPLWDCFRDSEDTRVRAVAYALRVAEIGECADHALAAAWATDALFDAIMLRYGRVDLGDSESVNGRAVMQTLEVAKAAYLVDVVCRCLATVDADDKELDRSIAAQAAIPKVRKWLSAPG